MTTSTGDGDGVKGFHLRERDARSEERPGTWIAQWRSDTVERFQSKVGVETPKARKLVGGDVEIRREPKLSSMPTATGMHVVVVYGSTLSPAFAFALGFTGGFGGLSTTTSSSSWVGAASAR